MTAQKETGRLPLKQQLAILKRILGYMLKSYKLAFGLVVVCIVGTALATLRGTLFMQSLIDDYIIPLTKAQVPDYSALAAAIASVAITYGIGILCAYIHQRLMVNISQGTMRNIRLEIFSHMESLPIRYFDTRAHGDIMSVYTNDVDTLRQVISQSIPQLINSIVTLVSTFAAMFLLDVPLTLVTLVMVCLMFFATSKIAGRASRYFTRQQKDLGTMNGYIEEMMNGQKVIKAFCHEQAGIEQFTKLNEQLRESTDKANTFANITMPVNANLGDISYVLCAVVGAILAINGYAGLTLGVLVAFLNLNRNGTQPVSQISQQTNDVVRAIAGAKRIFELLDEEPEADDGYVELVNVKEDADGSLTETSDRTNVWAWKHLHKADGTTTYQKLEGDITFDDVDFGYEAGKTVLHNIKLYATPGQKIAFVGSTGAGKTTITNLINRFYDIADGKIRYDGININKIKKADLRRSLGIVLQDTHLFTGTVMENIRYGRLDATDEECVAAAKLANADGFIRRLPEGYQTVLTGDGANLSQGQRQLLAIARAAVADPPVLILDEATSSIDTRTEALVQQGMDSLMNGRTTFVIAHRLSTVKNSDCIMVLEHGRIIERGSHDQLIAEKGRYYQLYTGHAIESDA
ncbi:MAG: ABC transporter ATP-binding protein [Faecousia sp.]